MVVYFITAVSERVGVTDVFQEGEILVRPNLKNLGVYIIQLRNSYLLSITYFQFIKILDNVTAFSYFFYDSEKGFILLIFKVNWIVHQ